MADQARAIAPVEACGILAGVDRRVTRLYEMTNVDNSSDHFMMNPAEQFSVIKLIRAAGLKMIAVYHSHPATPARPSEEDIRLALQPDVAWVILSLERPDEPYARAFSIDGDGVAEIPLTIVKG
ncbi:MAG: M67 family metallopeptidase [Phycisphaerae bacterium]|nr:M67 family metallopeptidase [Phycisphaerae bacterium]